MKTVIDLVNLIKDKFSMRKDIAPVETSSTASRAYKAGEEFYYGNLLQRATQDITQGSGLAGGVNFENADPVAVQVVSVKETLTNNVKCSGVVNYYQRTVESGRVGSSSSTVSRTVNADESITYSAGTVKADDSIAVNELISRPMYLADGTYDVSFGLNSAVSGFVYALLGWTGSAWTTLLSYDELSNKRQFIASNTYEYYSLQIKATHNTVVSTAFTIYPLVNEPWYSGNYVVPSLTNRQLTTDKVGMDLLSEVGAVNYADVGHSPYKTQAANSCTVSSQSDSSVTLSPTSSWAHLRLYYAIPAGTYKLRFKATASDSFVPFISIYKDDNNSSLLVNMLQPNVDNIITVPNDASYLSIRLYCSDGTSTTRTVTFNDLMITPVSYNGPDVPYAKTNRKLTEEVDKLTLLTKSVSGSLSNSGILALDIYKGAIPIGITWTSSAKPTLVNFTFNSAYNSWYARCTEWNGTPLTDGTNVAGTLTYIYLI